MYYPNDLILPPELKQSLDNLGTTDKKHHASCQQLTEWAQHHPADRSLICQTLINHLTYPMEHAPMATALTTIGRTDQEQRRFILGKCPEILRRRDGSVRFVGARCWVDLTDNDPDQQQAIAGYLRTQKQSQSTDYVPWMILYCGLMKQNALSQHAPDLAADAPDFFLSTLQESARYEKPLLLTEISGVLHQISDRAFDLQMMKLLRYHFCHRNSSEDCRNAVLQTFSTYLGVQPYFALPWVKSCLTDISPLLAANQANAMLVKQQLHMVTLRHSNSHSC